MSITHSYSRDKSRFYNHYIQLLVTKKTAQTLSVLLHPLLMPTVLYAILLYFSPAVIGASGGNVQWRFTLLGVIFVTTFLIPVISVVFLTKTRTLARAELNKLEEPGELPAGGYTEKGSFVELEMQDKKDRFVPFLSTTVFYTVITYMFFKQLHASYAMVLVMGTITFSIALITLISLFWKISAHSVGICGVAGFLFGFYYKFAEQQLFYPILGVILIAGLVMSARLALNAHSPVQVLTGGLIGFCVSFGSIYFLL
jgi:membrane-associated phospholipid phosphatase